MGPVTLRIHEVYVMKTLAFKPRTKVQWKWLGRPIHGVVKEVFLAPVTKTIKGKNIKRNGSPEKPAYLVESEAGNLALKLHTELTETSTTDKKTKLSKPTLFD
jgi:Hypervirulence associated proteins TUDOR domain